MNCWEYTKCGCEKGGRMAEIIGTCPAYPDHGRSCARIVGTLCRGIGSSTVANKQHLCPGCGFFDSHHYDHRDDNVHLLILSDSPAPPAQKASPY